MDAARFNIGFDGAINWHIPEKFGRNWHHGAINAFVQDGKIVGTDPVDAILGRSSINLLEWGIIALLGLGIQGD